MTTPAGPTLPYPIFGEHCYSFVERASGGSILRTRKADVKLPAFIPVTTFGGKYFLDEMLHAYLPRFWGAVMVSVYYAKNIDAPYILPTFIDSGGFASLPMESRVEKARGNHILITKQGTRITSDEIIETCERIGEVCFTLDIQTRPEDDLKTKESRQKMTLDNAVYLKERISNPDIRVFGSLTAWDYNSAFFLANEYKQLGLDGVGIGGLAVRKSPEAADDVIRGVIDAAEEMYVHAFGVGQPKMISNLFARGVHSADSSSPQQNAVARARRENSFAVQTDYLKFALDEFSRVSIYGKGSISALPTNRKLNFASKNTEPG
ncbi:MAG: hypothetical protein NUW37_07055 [Planctomycetes bacterium]|nr:hypothetical protein [Planctomycetota bacterium]